MIDSAFFFFFNLPFLRLRLRFGHEYPFSCFMVSRAGVWHGFSIQVYTMGPI